MLNTEKRNKDSMSIDKMPINEILKLMNRENMNSVYAVGTALKDIEKAIDAVVTTFNRGGRLIYIGAGTSGRLAVTDASECPPTFGVDTDMVRAIMAGGKECVFTAGENAEDDAESAINDLKSVNLESKDILIGISASGGAEYIVSAMREAKRIGCTVVSLTCNHKSRMESEADISIVADTGAEVITGSTRLKAGNAQKMILNMISTGAMVRSGKVRENLMINLKPSNIKLTKRMIGIVTELAGCDNDKAENALNLCGWDIGKAVDSLKKL